AGTDGGRAGPTQRGGGTKPRPPGREEHSAAGARGGKGRQGGGPSTNGSPADNERTSEGGHGDDPGGHPADPNTGEANWPQHR
ncbi:cutinase family protein, partial [Mycobacterium tuberculosis]